MSHSPGHSDLPPELLAIPGVAEAIASSAPAAAPNSAVVWVGTRTERPNRRPNLVEGTREFAPGGDVDDVMTVDEAYNEFYTWSDAQLRDFQERAFAAGLYGTNDREEIRWGDPTDGATFNLWVDRVDVAAGMYGASGRKVTPWDAVDLAAKGSTGIPAAKGRDKPPLTVELSNPADVKRLMREAAREALGSGKLDEKRLDEIVAAWHAEQRRAQTAQHAADESGGTVTQAPSFETFADEQAKATDPTGYDSRKVIGGLQHVFSMFDGDA